MVLLCITSLQIICLSCFQQIISRTFAIQWLSVLHKVVGGVTTSKTWFVIKGCTSLYIFPMLEFGLNNIIKHSTYLPIVKHDPEEYLVHMYRLLITEPLISIQIPYRNEDLRYRALTAFKLYAIGDIPHWIPRPI